MTKESKIIIFTGATGLVFGSYIGQHYAESGIFLAVRISLCTFLLIAMWAGWANPNKP